MKNLINTLKSRSFYFAKKIVSIALVFVPNLIAFPQERSVNIELFFTETDSLKQITAEVHEQHPFGKGDPIEGLDLYFYVQRTFSLLPIGSLFNTTDEFGKVEIEFPSDLPGDTAGNIILHVKIEDSPPYRDTSLQVNVAWGIPLVIDEKINKRTLWAARANAPLPLIILVNSILLVVWGLIVYILFQLYMIYKETSTKRTDLIKFNRLGKKVKNSSD